MHYYCRNQSSVLGGVTGLDRMQHNLRGQQRTLESTNGIGKSRFAHTATWLLSLALVLQTQIVLRHSNRIERTCKCQLVTERGRPAVSISLTPEMTSS